MPKVSGVLNGTISPTLLRSPAPQASYRALPAVDRPHTARFSLALPCEPSLAAPGWFQPYSLGMQRAQVILGEQGCGIPECLTFPQARKAGCQGPRRSHGSQHSFLAGVQTVNTLSHKHFKLGEILVFHTGIALLVQDLEQCVSPGVLV